MSGYSPVIISDDDLVAPVPSRADKGKGREVVEMPPPPPPRRDAPRSWIHDYQGSGPRRGINPRLDPILNGSGLALSAIDPSLVLSSSPLHPVNDLDMYFTPQPFNYLPTTELQRLAAYAENKRITEGHPLLPSPTTAQLQAMVAQLPIMPYSGPAPYPAGDFRVVEAVGAVPTADNFSPAFAPFSPGPPLQRREDGFTNADSGSEPLLDRRNAAQLARQDDVRFPGDLRDMYDINDNPIWMADDAVLNEMANVTTDDPQFEATIKMIRETEIEWDEWNFEAINFMKKHPFASTEANSTMNDMNASSVPPPNLASTMNNMNDFSLPSTDPTSTTNNMNGYFVTPARAAEIEEAKQKYMNSHAYRAPPIPEVSMEEFWDVWGPPLTAEQEAIMFPPEGPAPVTYEDMENYYGGPNSHLDPAITNWRPGPVFDEEAAQNLLDPNDPEILNYTPEAMARLNGNSGAGETSGSMAEGSGEMGKESVSKGKGPEVKGKDKVLGGRISKGKGPQGKGQGGSGMGLAF